MVSAAAPDSGAQPALVAAFAVTAEAAFTDRLAAASMAAVGVAASTAVAVVAASTAVAVVAASTAVAVDMAADTGNS
jgi:hypothetical protein